jgi:predicted permease
MPTEVRAPLVGRLLVRLCPLGERRAQVVADLDELLVARAAERGPAFARRRYVIDALSLWWPGRTTTVRVPVEAATASRRLWQRWGSLGQDVAFAARLGRRQPIPVAIAAGGLAIAIGATAATFTLLNAAALRPLGVAEPERAVRVWRMHQRGGSASWSYAEYVTLRERARTFRPEAWMPHTAVLSDPARASETTEVDVHFVTGTFFETFGGRAAEGRVLTPADDRSGAPLAAVLNYAFWQAHFGGDPAVVGRTVLLDEGAIRVVGVAERFFTGVVEAPALWLPLAPGGERWPSLGRFDRPGRAPVRISGRLEAGAGIPAVDAETRALAAAFNPGLAIAGDPPLTRGEAGALDNRGSLAILTAITLVVLGLVLLLACANVANLLLAGALMRQREISLRAALGAGRARIVRQLLTEGALVGALGGGLGLLVSVWAAPVLGRFLRVPSTADIGLEARTLAFACGAALLCGLVASVAPVRFGARRDLLTGLASESGHSTFARGSGRLRALFVGVQAAASIVLLVLAALFGRAIVAAATRDPGFEMDRLAVVSVSFPRDTYTASQREAFWNVAATRARSLPGIGAASVTMTAPLADLTLTTQVRHHGVEYVIHRNVVSPGFFETVGVPLARGRAFIEEDLRQEADVAVISARLARDFWGDSDPVGESLERISEAMRSTRVVGVAADAVMINVREPDVPVLYQLRRSASPLDDLVVRGRTADELAASLGPLRSAIEAIDPSVRVRTWLVRDSGQRDLGRTRTFASLAGLAGGLALALAVLGVFGVAVFSAGLRTREIAIRMATGATAADVVRLLLRDGLTPVAIGLGVGLLLAAWGGRVVSSVLLGIGPRDPVAMTSAAVVLLSTAALAILLPARRAARADPARLLR